MADPLSELSDEDVKAVAKGDMTKVSDTGVKILAGAPDSSFKHDPTKFDPTKLISKYNVPAEGLPTHESAADVAGGVAKGVGALGLSAVEGAASPIITAAAGAAGAAEYAGRRLIGQSDEEALAAASGHIEAARRWPTAVNEHLGGVGAAAEKLNQGLSEQTGKVIPEAARPAADLLANAAGVEPVAGALGAAGEGLESRIVAAHGEPSTEPVPTKTPATPTGRAIDQGFQVTPTSAQRAHPTADLSSLVEAEGNQGGPQVAQRATLHNAQLATIKVRKDIGVDPPNQPVEQGTPHLSEADFKQAEQAPSAVYAQTAKALGNVQLQRPTVAELQGLVEDAGKGLQPTKVGSFAKKVLKGLDENGSVDGGDLLQYSRDAKAMGQDGKDLTALLEGEVSAQLQKRGLDQQMTQYQQARTMFAKINDARAALDPASGLIDAKKYGETFAQEPGKLTGEAATVGEAAAAHPDIMTLPKPTKAEGTLSSMGIHGGVNTHGTLYGALGGVANKVQGVASHALTGDVLGPEVQGALRELPPPKFTGAQHVQTMTGRAGAPVIGPPQQLNMAPNAGAPPAARLEHVEGGPAVEPAQREMNLPESQWTNYQREHLAQHLHDLRGAGETAAGTAQRAAAYLKALREAHNL